MTVTPVPVPVRGAVCGLPGALSAMDTEAVRAPVAVGRKVTLIVQDAPAASVVPHVVVRAKSAALVPVSVMLLIDMVTFPLLRSVMLLAVLVVFKACVPNARDVGDRVAAGLVPVPVRVTCWGLVGSEFASCRVAVRVPDADGVNVTLMVQLEPASRLEAQVVVSPKSDALVPVSEIAIPVSAPVPTFLSVTIWAALVLPTL